MAVSKSNEEREGLIFRALADSTRRKLLDILKQHPGITVADLEPHFSMSRFNVMKHLNVLEEAVLIERERDGNSRKIFLKTEPLKLAHNRCKEWL
jgi:DNA-binding transcriptional ArsR family regulator